tara:strand:- start:2740 stop:3660 length:921 start_codon:yes stop_codon:yes gene_type:complete
MSVLKQKTISKPLEFNGIGLHSGKKVCMKLLPSSANSGICFKRTDVKSNNFIFPNVFNVSSASFCTRITNDFGISVSTIEHLMAALCGKGIDNLLIEINSEEVPILDGSAKYFVDEIDKCGLTVSEAPIKIITIDKKVYYEDSGKFITFEPSKISLEIDFSISFKNELISKQQNKINVYMDDLSDMYNSRTFCLYEDIEKLRNLDLGKGGSLQNAIVVKGNKILNDEKLRNNNEFVNHKILDCLGDLYLAGFKMVGKITSNQGGHYITNQGLRKLLGENSNFSIIELKEKNIPHSFLNKNILKSIA